MLFEVSMLAMPAVARTFPGDAPASREKMWPAGMRRLVAGHGNEQ